ncbi:hypothetical protein KC340_g4184 [Hortaea werneckii]|nr:hypothetical protein KC342_g4235 [Hortaea werneckii]KAI7109658.1 hypothetical protein KC339_g597 [Hortaea werneckii]KAI7243460.1 hypothetical protein KC365_g2293 [Hortaea werneckii]KAI7330508.1 hypothetical protein KC340_g4184 [Hortaea werneckii]KAI7404668.1 hypothetical protein KC328_g1853 [Hortaea werneckii]
MALALPLLASLYLASYHVSAQMLSSDPFINNSWNGEFTWPAGSTGSFDQGSPMGIAWQSPYQLVNIYLIWNQTVGKPIVNQCQVATGRPGNVTYDWTVSCAMPPNCATAEHLFDFRRNINHQHHQHHHHLSLFYLHNKSKLVDNYLITAEVFICSYAVVRYQHHILLPED